MEVIARMETEEDLLAVTPIRPDSDNDNSLSQTDGVANQIQATSDKKTYGDSTTKAASNPEKKKHEQSHINGTAKLNMRQTDGMVREDKTDIERGREKQQRQSCGMEGNRRQKRGRQWKKQKDEEGSKYSRRLYLSSRDHGRDQTPPQGRYQRHINQPYCRLPTTITIIIPRMAYKPHSGVVLPSFLTLFTSLCFSVSKELFIVLRVLEGLGQALMYPALNSMLTAWVPPRERDTFMAVLLSGAMLGTMLAMLVGGWLSSCSGIFMFYLFSCLGVLWGVPWDIVAHDHPERHPRISKAELDYIIAHRTYVKRDKVAATTPVKYLVAGTTSTDFIFNNGTLEELLRTLWALIVLYAQRASPVFWNAAALLTN
ncbi:hypothetical protein Pmani_033643 [Petrolisthes manimaculis]|uniref:Major facilitator superfamily (MFS) profile domain-containing protein n=1 Tax=Petrolisthes manimaculis TaxID=1843537 RepID=A0AAE1TQ69_9EUCA|nr:hypothetical protein Pmani_033643 [Petrolisthes manimaculis]